MSLNPFCEIAIEEAVRHKAAGEFSNITGLTIGPAEYNKTREMIIVRLT